MVEKRPLRILYGETFDGTNPIDSLRYYFFVSLLSSAITSCFGLETNSTVLIADTAEYINRPNDTGTVLFQAKKRLQFANCIKSKYGCSYTVKLQTDSDTTGTMDLGYEGLDSPEMRSMLRSTVPKHRLEQEMANGFKYTMSEIGEILRHDIKVGPPREAVYDNLAATIATNIGFKYAPLAIHLTPAYPFGMKFGEYAGIGDMHCHGLVPYKSLGRFEQNRIIIGKTSEEKATGLINSTELSRSRHRPNPIFPVLSIAEMAECHLSGRFEHMELYDAFYRQNMREDNSVTANELREMACFGLSNGLASMLEG